MGKKSGNPTWDRLRSIAVWTGKYPPPLNACKKRERETALGP